MQLIYTATLGVLGVENYKGVGDEISISHVSMGPVLEYTRRVRIIRIE